jgi:hypothetical protein
LLTQDDKARYAAAGAAVYAAAQSEVEAWSVEDTKGNTKATGAPLFDWISANILGNNVVDYDQIFSAQHLELSKGIVEVFRTMVSSQNRSADQYEESALAQLTFAMTEFLKALDPPDWNYTVVEPPQHLSLPATGNSTVDKDVKDYLTCASLEAATLHAAERWQAANIVGDKKSAALQLGAFKTYSAEATKGESVLSSDDLALSKALRPVNVNSYPGGAQGLAAAINAACGQRLPSSLNAALLSLGLSQTAIDEQVCEVAGSVTASEINTNFEPLLTAPRP